MREKSGGNRIAYIPSGPDPERYFFNACKTYCTRLGLDVSLHFDLDVPHSAEEIADLFASNAIHLSGGHTGDFLTRLKRSAMLGPLRDWALKGGILIGVSAGAILMAPTIATDALFLGEMPEDVADGDALDLLPFEVFPHLDADATYRPALVRYSRHTARPILACNDGDGAVVTEGRVECFGSPVWIVDGAIKPASDVAPLDAFFSRTA